MNLNIVFSLLSLGGRRRPTAPRGWTPPNAFVSRGAGREGPARTDHILSQPGGLLDENNVGYDQIRACPLPRSLDLDQVLGISLSTRFGGTRPDTGRDDAAEHPLVVSMIAAPNNGATNAGALVANGVRIVRPFDKRPLWVRSRPSVSQCACQLRAKSRRCIGVCDATFSCGFVAR